MDEHFYDEEDLVTASQPDRNWRGIIIAVLVIASVCALIVTSVVLLTPPDDGPRVKGRRFELEDIFGPEFQPLRMNGTWKSGHQWIYRDSHGGVSILDVKNMSSRSLVSNVTFKRFNAVSFVLSSDLRFILLTHDVQKVHRYSYLAKYTLFEINTGETRAITVDKTISSAAVVTHSTLQFVKWSPKGSSLVLVHQGDIYYKPDPKEKTTFRITDSARPDVIFNGIPDWLYEEEILGSNSAMWFSSDGQRLLYLTFNDSLVGEHHLLYYGSVEDPLLYPKVKTLRYPKPGTKNPTVTARICDLEKIGSKLVTVEPPEGISTLEYYITAAGWVHNTHVSIIWTSRSFNLSIISICTAKNGTCEEIYRITTEKRGWVETVPFPIFSSKGNSKNFVTIAPIRDGENGFFDHLVLVDTINKRSHPITHGSYDVLKTNAWDEANKLIYFTATPASHPGERRLYRIRVEQPYTEHSPDCLSCGPEEERNDSRNDSGKVLVGKTKAQTEKLAEEEVIAGLQNKGMSREESVSNQGSMLGSNKSCLFVSNVKFSVDRSYFIVECAGPDVPFVALYASTVAPAATPNVPPAANIRLIQILQHNEALQNSSKKMAFPQVRTFAVHMTGGHTVQVKLLLPPGLREDEITRYPLVLNVYGGPGTQLALDRWSVDFPTYLASKKDYIVAQIDSRGSGGKGWDFQHKVYYKLGIHEAEDQIEVIKYLRDSLHFVEPKKIGVWGWSYGGYLTAMIMNSKLSTEKDVFRCGASIAPVSNWRLYDSAYTEKYMGTPNVTDNYKGYSDSDVTRNVENFADKMFYLIHGTADDNVHIQHSMLLAKALIAKKILFRQQVYPDEPHGLNGVKLHVHKSLELFFEDCFRKASPPIISTGLHKGGKITNDAV